MLSCVMDLLLPNTIEVSGELITEVRRRTGRAGKTPGEFIAQAVRRQLALERFRETHERLPLRYDRGPDYRRLNPIPRLPVRQRGTHRRFRHADGRGTTIRSVQARISHHRSCDRSSKIPELRQRSSSSMRADGDGLFLQLERRAFQKVTGTGQNGTPFVGGAAPPASVRGGAGSCTVKVAP